MRCYCSNRTLTAKFQEAIVIKTIIIADRRVSSGGTEWSREEMERRVSGNNISSVSVIFYGKETSSSSSNGSFGKDIQFSVSKSETKIIMLEDHSWDIYGAGYGNSDYSVYLSKYSIIVDGVTIVDKKTKDYVISETIIIGNIHYVVEYTTKYVSSFN